MSQWWELLGNKSVIHLTVISDILNSSGGDIGFDVGDKTSGACRVGNNTRTPSVTKYSRKRR